MACLSALVSQYPIVDRICRDLRVADFAALSQANSRYRLMLKGLPHPSPSSSPTSFRPVNRSCTCVEDYDACCPRHGTTTLRNLLKKTNRTCEDPMHNINHTVLGRSVPDIWASTICDALGGISDANYCSDCRITVCWICWLDPNHTPSRGSLPHYACGECWEADFETLRRRRPHRFGHATFNSSSWKLAQEQGAFCQCIPPILCSPCTAQRKVCPKLTQPNQVAHIHRVLDSTNRDFSMRWYEFNLSSPHYECAGCAILVSENDRFPPNLFCPDCNLPKQMRNQDHPINRQSQVNGTYRNDVNYNTGRVSPDYGSIREFWVDELTKRKEDVEYLLPKDWEPVEFAWELFNEASLIPAEKKDTVSRSSYFLPIKEPVWECEEILFAPPPYITSFNGWQDITRVRCYFIWSEQLMTYEQFMKWHGSAEKALEEQSKALGRPIISCYPTARNFLVRAEYFKPIQRPVWDFEHSMFEITDQE